VKFRSLVFEIQSSLLVIACSDLDHWHFDPKI